MNRGRRGEDIFSAPDDFSVFIKLLKESAEQWNVLKLMTVSIKHDQGCHSGFCGIYFRYILLRGG